MMNAQQRRSEPIEKIILATQQPGWVAFSIGGCGILTCALVGRHQKEYQESQRIALAFAYHVVQAVSFSLLHNPVSTPQILVDAADTVIDDPEHVFLIGTTWQYLSGEVEICSVGSNSVLVFEGQTIREVIAPQNVSELLRKQGQMPDLKYRYQVTHVLGSRKSKKSCLTNDIRITRIPLLPNTTLAVVVNRLLVEAMMEQAIPGSELFSFIEKWNPPGKKRSTSVLISL
jgi:hypothetical protein